MTPEQRKLVLELLRCVQREYTRLAALYGALADTLETADAQPCQSYGEARERGERRAADVYDDSR